MKLGKSKFFNIANDIFHPLRNKIVSNVINNLKDHNHAVFASDIIRQNTNTIKIVSNVINNLKDHNHAVFASDIIRQNTNTIVQYNTEIWDKEILTKN